MQFKICEFWTLFHFFVYDHGPGARAPHIANNFFLQNRSPNKYIGKVDKRWFIRYNGFCARYKNVPGGALRAPPLPWIGLMTFFSKLSTFFKIVELFGIVGSCQNWWPFRIDDVFKRIDIFSFDILSFTSKITW